MKKTYEATAEGYVPKSEGVGDLRRELTKIIKERVLSKRGCRVLLKALKGNQKMKCRRIDVRVTIKDEDVS